MKGAKSLMRAEERMPGCVDYRPKLTTMHAEERSLPLVGTQRIEGDAGDIVEWVVVPIVADVGPQGVMVVSVTTGCFGAVARAHRD